MSPEAPTDTVVSSPPPSASSASKVFRLFDLPDELVLRILKFSVVISNRDDPLTIYDEKTARQPVIMRTCHLFRHEGLKLFYTYNFFLANSGRSQIQTFWNWVADIWLHSSAVANLYMTYAGESGSTVELEEITWDDWHDELTFVRSEAISGCDLYVRTCAGKIVMGQDRVYRLSLRDESHDPARWSETRPLLAKINDMFYSIRNLDTDTSIPPEEAGHDANLATAKTESTQQDSGKDNE